MKIDIELTVSGLDLAPSQSNRSVEQITFKFNQEINAQELLAVMSGYADLLKRFFP